MRYAPVRQPRIADVLTERLESMIIEGSLKPGERLPPERTLAEQFEVSRPSVREAIQKLAARGLLTSRQGGGTYVSEELARAWSDPLSALLGRHGEFNLDLLEFRDALEGISAYYAAMRSTPADKAMLRQRFEDLEKSFEGRDPEREAGADAAFHLAIAEAAHNVVLLHSMRSLFQLLEKSIVANLRHLFEKPESRPRLIQQHRSLFEAIMQGRAEDARNAAHEHLVFVEDSLLELERAETRAQRALRRAQAVPDGS